MKTPFRSLIFRRLIPTIALATSMFLGYSAAAQFPQPMAKATIPFDFRAGDRYMPAGLYRLDAQGGALVLLRGDLRSAFVMTHAAMTLHPTSQSRLIFERYGSQYFLRQVWPAGCETGAELLKGRPEREMLQAAKQSPPSMVEIAVLSPKR